MAYQIPYTDEANNGTLTVVDGTLNEETTLKIPGRNFTGYGQAIAENFLHLLENFSNSIEPPRPTEGQLWYDTTPGVDQLKVYNGANWVPAGNVNRAANAPDVALAQTGDLWVDTENQQLYLNSGSAWVLVGPTFSEGLSTGAFPLTVTGTDNVSYTVILVEVQAQPLAIISTQEFTPKSAIAGFNIIRPGINISNRDISGDGAARFIGTSEKAESLLVGTETVAAGNFLRGDTTSNTDFPLNVRNNTGIRLGTDAALSIGIEGQAGIIQHQIEGSNIDVRVRSQGTSRTVLRVDSARRLGINNEAPDEALDVVGNIKTDANLFVDGNTQSVNTNSGSIVTKGGVGIAKDLNVGGNSKFANLTTLGNAIPDGNNTRNFGSPTAKWQTVHATSFIGNLTGNVNGTVSGTAGSAERLASASTFRITGDVSSQDVIFDGQTGGALKVFNTEISNDFIADKDEVFSSRSDDEIIINRQSGDTGLFKINRNNLLRAVPTNPPGVILPYGGVAAPAGWLLCDGSEYLIADFSVLFEAIGYNFASRLSASTQDPARTLEDLGLFRVPDLRGRMPMGLDNMGGNSAGRISEGAADQVGLSSGSETTNINLENLPEHEHDLRGSNGDQFYAIRDVSGAPGDPDGIQFDAPNELDNAQALPKSGGILKDINVQIGQPLGVLNPFTAMNYIIFTGRTT